MRTPFFPSLAMKLGELPKIAANPAHQVEDQINELFLRTFPKQLKRLLKDCLEGARSWAEREDDSKLQQAQEMVEKGNYDDCINTFMGKKIPHGQQRELKKILSKAYEKKGHEIFKRCNSNVLISQVGHMSRCYRSAIQLDSENEDAIFTWYISLLVLRSQIEHEPRINRIERHCQEAREYIYKKIQSIVVRDVLVKRLSNVFFSQKNGSIRSNLLITHSVVIAEELLERDRGQKETRNSLDDIRWRLEKHEIDAKYKHVLEKIRYAMQKHEPC